MVVAQWFGQDRMDELIEAKTGSDPHRPGGDAARRLAVRHRPAEVRTIAGLPLGWCTDADYAPAATRPMSAPSIGIQIFLASARLNPVGRANAMFFGGCPRLGVARTEREARAHRVAHV